MSSPPPATQELHIPYDQFRRANTRDHCLIALDGNVYDVTPFLSEHPGGQIVLLQNGGKDATRDFNLINHSQNALQMREKFRVGKLSGLFNMPNIQDKGGKDGEKLQQKEDNPEELNARKERRKKINDAVKGVTAVLLVVALGVLFFRMVKKVPNIKPAN